MSDFAPEDREAMEEMINEVVKLMKRSVARGQKYFKNFDDKINSAAERGVFGDGMEMLGPMLVELGDEDVATLIFAIANDDRLVEKLQSMSLTDAIQYLRSNRKQIVDSLDLKELTQDGYVELRRPKNDGLRRWKPYGG